MANCGNAIYGGEVAARHHQCQKDRAGSIYHSCIVVAYTREEEQVMKIGGLAFWAMVLLQVAWCGAAERVEVGRWGDSRGD